MSQIRRIGFAGTDARTLLWAKETTKGNLQGVVIRGNRAMEEYVRQMGWPVEFISTIDNSAKALAQAGVEAFKSGRLDYLLAQSENHYYDGFVDEVAAAGFGDRVAGLARRASFIEGDKVGAKQLCRIAEVPVADLWEAVDVRDVRKIRSICCDFIDRTNGVVLKYPYRAGGKGARVILDTWQIAEVYNRLVEDYSKDYGSICGSNQWPLLIESLMGGPEISFTVFTDDHGNFQILPTSMDYARRYPGPAGPHNPVTGGMGAISPHPLETPELLEMARKTIVTPFISTMRELGYLRKCVLYFGCFVSVDGFGQPTRIRVSEINIRMGEPEVQTVVRRLKNPGELIVAMFENRLHEVAPEIRDDQLSITIALVTGPGGPDGQKGYPGSCTIGEVLEFDSKYLQKKNILLVPSGADYKDGVFLSDGTRIVYLIANAKCEPGMPPADSANGLREKLLNTFRQGKVRVIPRENPEGNRLTLREDCGSEYDHFSRIFYAK
ncbi:hypothetical protein EPO05_01965 [Patescibacteria group bacterium]|nr:MAG: hypothetical protein EPO05_01965 [Patescibacteria group bacterium]